MIECYRCRRALTSPVYSDSGAAYGSTCAERVGLVREATKRVRAHAPLAVPRACGDVARQVAIAWPDAAIDYAATPFAAWPWVAAHRAERAGDPRATAGCEGCEVFGVCARCAGVAAKRERAANAAGKNTNGPPLPGRPAVPAV